MYQYTGPRQTTGATANFSVGDFPTATYVPVPAVSANACLPSNSGLMSSFAQQAHNFATTSGFAAAAQPASPMVRAPGTRKVPQPRVLFFKKKSVTSKGIKMDRGCYNEVDIRDCF